MSSANDLVSRHYKDKLHLEEIVARVLETLQNSGRSDAAEVLIRRVDRTSVSSRGGEVENILSGENSVLIINNYSGHHRGTSRSNALDERSIADSIAAVVKTTQYSTPDLAFGPADKDLLAYCTPDLDLFHPIDEDLDGWVDMSRRAESAALGVDRRVRHAEGSEFSSCSSVHTFGNSYGMLQSYSSSYHSIYCSVIAEQGNCMERGSCYTNGRSFGDLDAPEDVGKRCALRALERLGSSKLSTAEVPVIFIAEVAAELFEHLLEAIGGDNVHRRSTFLANDLGKGVLPNWLDIQERPQLPRGLASAPFDDEGVKTRDRAVVKNGVLTTWLLDSFYSRKLGLRSTGHAGRTYNWIVSHHPISFDALVRKMYRGLVITELMGCGVNLTTGDYSRGAVGFWVEDGAIKHPVSGITVAGDLRRMLGEIVDISDDVELRKKIRCGSVLISSMKIAGD